MSIIIPRRAALIGGLAAVFALAARGSRAAVIFPPAPRNAWMFTGGPIATLGSLVAGSGYVNGTYTAVPLTGGTGSGATANITVSGGVVTACTLVFGGAALQNASSTQPAGVVGYLVGDVLSAAVASIGGGAGSGFSVSVATIGAITWVVPPFVTQGVINGAAAGGGGAGGQATSGAGGGGGAGAMAWVNLPVLMAPGSTITIGPLPMGGLGGAIGLIGVAGGTLTVTGFLNSLGIGLIGGNPGNPGAAGTGGAGANGNNNFGGSLGGAAGAAAGAPALRNLHVLGGLGGGGGGNSAGFPGGGGLGYPFQGGATFNTNGNGGGGGASYHGQGGGGGNVAAGGSGALVGYGAGGGGGAQNTAGGAGGNAFFEIIA